MKRLFTFYLVIATMTCVQISFAFYQITDREIELTSRITAKIEAHITKKGESYRDIYTLALCKARDMKKTEREQVLYDWVIEGVSGHDRGCQSVQDLRFHGIDYASATSDGKATETLEVGKNVEFSATLMAYRGGEYVLSINFGDGNSEQYKVKIPNKGTIEYKFSHVFSKSGTYYIGGVLSDTTGNSFIYAPDLARYMVVSVK